MNTHGKLVCTVMTVVCLLVAETALGWTANGWPICTETGDQTEVQLVADGEGGFFAVWQDQWSGNWDIYAQRFDLRGDRVWAQDLAVCTANSDQVEPRAVTDGSGGFYVVWTDYRTGVDIYGQRVYPDGSIHWGTNGVVICDAIGNQFRARLTEDGYGGAVVVWNDSRDNNGNIYAQRIASPGTMDWTPNGIPLTIEANTQTNADIALLPGTDMASTRFTVVWEDYRFYATSGVDIYAQRLTLDGVIQWGQYGMEMSTHDYNEFNPSVAGGLSGSSYIAWERTFGSFYYDDVVYARIDRYGVQEWGSNFEGHAPVLEPNGLGGVLMGYHKTNEFTFGWSNGSVRSWAQDASYLFSTDFSTNYNWQVGDIGTRIAGDGLGGMVACSFFYGSGNPALDATGSNADGSWRWETLRIRVCDSPDLTSAPAIITVDSDHVVLAWCDDRNLADSGLDIYAQRMSMVDGAWGYAPPFMRTVSDIPGDEGGAVIIEIRASDSDVLDGIREPITGYNVWRKIPSSKSTLNRDQVLARATDPDLSRGLVVDSNLAAKMAFPEGDWVSIGFHAATLQAKYLFQVNTLSDYTSQGTPWETYLVTAHTPTPSLFYTSDPDSGYSVDNLAPGVLQGLAAVAGYQPSGLNLDWQAGTEPDLARYTVHRGTHPAFLPTEANRVATPTSPGWMDDQWTASSGYHYKVAAVDRHDNIGAFAVVTPEQISGQSLETVPLASVLLQNRPNPFNPFTTISFELASPGRADLRIFDVTGRLVRHLIAGESIDAGLHEMTWNGRDSRGRSVPSGAYYYRLDTADFSQTRRMMLIR